MKNTLTVDGETFLRLTAIDTSLAVEIIDIADFAAVKRKLLRLYGDISIAADGKACSLGKLSGASDISIPPQRPFEKQRYNLVDVIRIVERLTVDETGCPWDRSRTHENIRSNLIEEAYEAVDAIDKRDVENMREEFGDVLLQSVLQSDISRRNGEFDFNDVCDELCKKLISRHSFIFGADSAATADDALGLWEKNKAKQKNYDGIKSQLEKLPDNFPSLLYAQKTYKKLKKAGRAFEPQNELSAALEAGDYARALVALAAAIEENGGDAEVELNKLVKQIIAGL